MAYLVRKLLHSLILLFGVSLLVFALLALAPGDFFSEMRLNPRISNTSIEQMRVRQELDRPLPIRYWHWLRAVARGDWGRSLAYQEPVWPLIWSRAVNTLILASTATVIAWILALTLGIAAASRPRGLLDHFLAALTSGLLAIPDILLSLLLLLFAVHTRLLPLGGMESLDQQSQSGAARVLDLARHLVLPVSALVLVGLPVLLRHVRASVGEALTSPAIKTARAAGVSRTRLLFRHALPLASNPLISLLGLSIAALLSGSLLVEVILSWPGLGPLLLEAIFARDIYVVIGAVMLSTLFLIAGNYIADVLLLAVDPRTREVQP